MTKGEASASPLFLLYTISINDEPVHRLTDDGYVN